jgi:hypothetical protein
MMSVNMSVPARIVKGVATALIAGSRTPGFRDALAVCFWFTQDAVRLVPLSSPALLSSSAGSLPVSDQNRKPRGDGRVLAVQLGMSFLETQHGPTLRGMLDMLVEVRALPRLARSRGSSLRLTHGENPRVGVEAW